MVQLGQERILTRRQLELQHAAESKGVEQQFIDEVNTWNGEDDLEDDDEQSNESNHEDGEGDTPMEIDTIPVPPARVTEVYKKATPLFGKPVEDPTNPEVLGQLDQFNHTIREGNKAQNILTPNEDDYISIDQWLMPVSFFKPHYADVLGEYRIL
jgi:hypothetical protein